ncbi:MAG: phosphotransferase [bacterium]
MDESLHTLFKSRFGEEVTRSEAMPIHGSNRKRFRIFSKNRTVIGVSNEDRAENIAFLEFSRHFHQLGLPVPEIYAQDLDAGIYLEEDLGKRTLFDLLEKQRRTAADFPDQIEALYEKAVRRLPDFQVKAGKTLNYAVCYPRHSFDHQSINWDLNYFKYYFLKLARIPFNEQRLEDDFARFTTLLLQADCSYFLYRDFQSRNIMIRDDEPYFIDYQGGRRGALQYDIASLLYDAKANLPSQTKERLLAAYLDALGSHLTLDRKAFMKYYTCYVLVRIMQAMGAYGFRGFYERKTHFLQSVPYAIQNLESLLQTTEWPVVLPTLMECLQRIVRSTRLRELGDAHLPLTVRIQSFSYKEGLPQDDTGHGGGFIFDCRALPNPGRLPQYENQNGNDPEVIHFLENKEQVHSFLTRVRDLISQVVEDYQQRNFSHLSIAFGCTGGRHRSVYCANQLAKYLREKYRVKVDLSHREAESWPA